MAKRLVFKVKTPLIEVSFYENHYEWGVIVEDVRTGFEKNGRYIGCYSSVPIDVIFIPPLAALFF